MAIERTRRPPLVPWADYWYRVVAGWFVAGYREVPQPHQLMTAEGSTMRAWLGFYALEKAVYELGYELNNRPSWVEVPIRGLLAHLPRSRRHVP
jgi:maltose alpha-D-glucosyltransferase/alpha-amylase